MTARHIRVGGDTPALGREAVAFVERWRRSRRAWRVNYWLARLMTVPGERERPKEQR